MTPASEQDDEDRQDARPRPTRTLLRGLSVLDAIADAKRALGPTEIGAIVGLDKGTVSRLLVTLEEAGYLQRDNATRTFALSSKVLRLSNAFFDRLDLRRVAHPHLQQLSDEVGETVHLGIRDGAQVVYVDKIEAQHQAIRMVSTIGQTMPVHTTALGKAMLSRYPRDVRDEVLDQVRFATRSTRTVMDRATLLAHLEEAQQQGYAVDDRENEDMVTCVGAAITDAGGDVRAAISISSPTFRVEGRVAELGRRCQAVAEVISEELGGAAFLP